MSLQDTHAIDELPAGLCKVAEAGVLIDSGTRPGTSAKIKKDTRRIERRVAGRE
jgi:hypothetical protein